MAGRDQPGLAPFFQLCFSKRPAEELYDLRQDPFQLKNVAGQAPFAETQKQLRARLEQWMKETGDPRGEADDDRWDTFPYFGGR